MSKYSFSLNFVLAMDFFSLDCFVYAVSDWSLNVHCRNCKSEMEISVSLVSDLLRSVQPVRGQKQCHIPLSLAGISERYKIAWEEKKPPRTRSVVYYLCCYSTPVVPLVFESFALHWAQQTGIRCHTGSNCWPEMVISFRREQSVFFYIHLWFISIL